MCTGHTLQSSPTTPPAELEEVERAREPSAEGLTQSPAATTVVLELGARMQRAAMVQIPELFKEKSTF